MSASSVILWRKNLGPLRDGPFGPYLDRLADRYTEQRFSRERSLDALMALEPFGRWLNASELKACDVSERLIEDYLERSPLRLHQCTRPALRSLLVVLREAAVCPPPLTVPRGPDQILEDEFRQYLVSERNLADRTIEHYTEAARVFLAACSRNNPCSVPAWTAADVLTFLQRRVESRQPVHVQQLCTGLRAFLRYLQFRGATKTDLARTIPRIARWRLATLPKALSAEQVERILEHCDRRTAVGRRDYAVLLLLVRLGLRADEIRTLTLDDIHWRAGELTIRGKGRGPEPMPLPNDVGEALAAYLTNGRPPSSSRAVFVHVKAPYTPYNGIGALGSITVRAMRRARVDAPSKGTHVFRHTLATRMLSQGASLREIGQLLRHRDEDTTRIYAKVDLVRLRTLALPWPGGAP